MPRSPRPKPVHQLTAAQFDALFPHEDACKAYLQARRWPDGVHCPRCGNPKVYDLASREWHWQCSQCSPDGYRFSILVGTIFENTNKPLRDWFKVIHLMLTSKKGMSALQIFRYMGFGSYKTAWMMCHKVRVALVEDVEQLGGIVELDEAFVGGLAKNRHKDKRGGGGGTGGIGSGKTPIVGAVKRKGNVIARVVDNVRASTLEAFVHEAVSHKAACSVPINGLVINISAKNIRTPSLTTPKSNTWSARSTRKPSKVSGRSSSAAWSAHSTRSARVRTFSERRLRDAKAYAVARDRGLSNWRRVSAFGGVAIRMVSCLCKLLLL